MIRCAVGICALLALCLAPAAHASDQVVRPLGETIAVHARVDGPVRERVRALTEAGAPTTLLVLARRAGRNGQKWLRVRLARRPNRASGWVRARTVELRTRPQRVVIDLSARRLTVWRGTRRILTTRVVIGAPRTPTPTGTFAVWQTLPGKPRSTGPVELQLTARSRAARGRARLAIHGMQGRLRARPGSAVSHGCIRTPTRPLLRLARLAPEGTRVTIRR